MYQELTNKLISIPSNTSDFVQLQKVIETAQQAITTGHTTRYLDQSYPSLLVSNQPNTTHFRLILNAHLDVVPAPDHLFTPKIDGDKLIGRGAQDMKAAAAVMIHVFNEIADKINYPLGLQLVTDEETGGFHGTKHQIEQGIRADFVVAGEPTDYGINNQAKGILWAKITTTGQSAHGAYPWNGINAITKMNQVITALNQKFPVPATESWLTTVNLAKIETTNQTFNKVPDSCTLSIDTRFIPQDADTIAETIKNLIPDTQVEILLNEPSQYTAPDHPDILQLQKITQQIIGQTPPNIQKHGGSDIRLFNAVGCDGITFGPIGAGLHTDEEWVSLSSLEYYHQILKQFCLSLT